LLKIKQKLKDLLSNLNGTTITGIWVKINMKMRFKRSLGIKKQLRLQLNKKSNHSLSSQLILQLKWMLKKQILKREISNNSLKLRPNSTLNSMKLPSSKKLEMLKR